MTSAARGGVTVRVPAKINLELIIGPRRADGYHGLSTVFHAVGLYDDVTVVPAPRWGATVSGPYAALVPAGGDNLAVRAARLLAERAGSERAADDDADTHALERDETERDQRANGGCAVRSVPTAESRPVPDPRPGPVHIHIAKEIPVAAGMAGGSADAAATLVACDALWRLGSDRELLDELAATLGSDINFALTGGTAIGSGRGERVAPVLGRGRYHWVLAVSETGLSTPAVFAECDRLREERGETDIPDPEPSPAMMAALRSGDPRALGSALRNDLQEAALSLRPELAEVLEAGLEYGALGGIVSGSGPTLAFLVDGPEGALDLAVALTASGVASDVKRAIGPAHGAHVLPAATAVR
ncbi:4-(cytidine 5'-diphospho)-2-C-methyl-D-erythritol kinase [Piscicoccus intestinalis]|uniref:4-(cytidine 5'-diphospho)-2-C-methyl-D-erythritol kinase n=1 Tax=Piscicoccus intestinalis TaxID=746033 RepID=UPI000837F1B3|nr:4-(cytidine 5'-diphospho)-2-C-methyl-D-erythritol kinase [Piscicoccus intestinalis]